MTPELSPTVTELPRCRLLLLRPHQNSSPGPGRSANAARRRAPPRPWSRRRARASRSRRRGWRPITVQRLAESPDLGTVLANHASATAAWSRPPPRRPGPADSARPARRAARRAGQKVFCTVTGRDSESLARAGLTSQLHSQSNVLKSPRATYYRYFRAFAAGRLSRDCSSHDGHSDRNG